MSSPRLVVATIGAALVALLLGACADPNAPKDAGAPASTRGAPDPDGQDRTSGGPTSDLPDGAHHGMGRAVDVDSRRFVFQPDGTAEAAVVALESDTTYVVYVAGREGGGHITEADLETFAEVVNAAPDRSWTVTVRAGRVVSVEQDSDVTPG